MGGLGDPLLRAPPPPPEASEGCSRSSSPSQQLVAMATASGRKETSFNSGHLPHPSEALLGDLAECPSGYQGWRRAQALLWEFLGHCAPTSYWMGFLSPPP